MERHRTKLFKLSMFLNGLLLISLTYFEISRPRIGSDKIAIENAPNEVEEIPSETIVTNSVQARFTWDMLRQQNLPAYIENLRQIGCPEKTIHEIIITEVENRFSKRALEFGAQEEFWLTASQKLLATRQFHNVLSSLEQEKASLYQDLLSTHWDQNAYLGWVFDSSAEATLGFLPVPKAMEVLDHMNRISRRVVTLRKENGGITFPSDRIEMEQMVRQAESTLLPSELEELNLRENCRILLPFGLFDVEISGPEFRELVRLRSDNFNIFRTLAHLSNHEGKPSSSNPEETERAIKALLGEGRYAGYVRATDVQFQILCEISRQFNLEDSAIKIYEIRQSTLADFQRLETEQFQSEQERKSAIQLAAESAKLKVKAILGEQVFLIYSQSAGAWWEHKSITNGGGLN